MNTHTLILVAIVWLVMIGITMVVWGLGENPRKNQHKKSLQREKPDNVSGIKFVVSSLVLVCTIMFMVWFLFISLPQRVDDLNSAENNKDSGMLYSNGSTSAVSQGEKTGIVFGLAVDSFVALILIFFTPKLVGNVKRYVEQDSQNY